MTRHFDMKRHLIRVVESLKPGESCLIDRFELGEIPEYEHNAATFTAADQILEGIIGAAYTHGYQHHWESGGVEFYRVLNPVEGRRTYISPDHRTKIIRKSPLAKYR